MFYRMLVKLPAVRHNMDINAPSFRKSSCDGIVIHNLNLPLQIWAAAISSDYFVNYKCK